MNLPLFRARGTQAGVQSKSGREEEKREAGRERLWNCEIAAVDPFIGWFGGNIVWLRVEGLDNAKELRAEQAFSKIAYSI